APLVDHLLGLPKLLFLTLDPNPTLRQRSHQSLAPQPERFLLVVKLDNLGTVSLPVIATDANHPTGHGDAMHWARSHKPTGPLLRHCPTDSNAVLLGRAEDVVLIRSVAVDVVSHRGLPRDAYVRTV